MTDDLDAFDHERHVERARTVMYTSTEPCPMCAGGLHSYGKL